MRVPRLRQEGEEVEGVIGSGVLQVLPCNSLNTHFNFYFLGLAKTESQRSCKMPKSP